MGTAGGNVAATGNPFGTAATLAVYVASFEPDNAAVVAHAAGETDGPVRKEADGGASVFIPHRPRYIAVHTDTSARQQHLAARRVKTEHQAAAAVGYRPAGESAAVAVGGGRPVEVALRRYAVGNPSVFIGNGLCRPHFHILRPCCVYSVGQCFDQACDGGEFVVCPLGGQQFFYTFDRFRIALGEFEQAVCECVGQILRVDDLQRLVSGRGRDGGDA